MLPTGGAGSRERVLVWGDGAVGKGLSVALASTAREVVLVGPPGSGRGTAVLASEGPLSGRAAVRRAESGDALGADVSLLAVKAYDLAEVAPRVRGSGALPAVCVANGMGLESVWGPGWADEVEPAVLSMGFRELGPGRVATSPGEVVCPEGGAGARLFVETDLPLREVGDIEVSRWAKWLVNSVINPLGALTGLPNDRLLRAGLGGAVRMLLEELVPVVPEGLRPEAVPEARGMLERLLDRSDNRCSMLQDLERGRRTEIGFLTGLGLPPGSGRGGMEGEAGGMGRPLCTMLRDLVLARSRA